jgi:hypothetical protein
MSAQVNGETGRAFGGNCPIYRALARLTAMAFLSLPVQG